MKAFLVKGFSKMAITKTLQLVENSCFFFQNMYKTGFWLQAEHGKVTKAAFSWVLRLSARDHRQVGVKYQKDLVDFIDPLLALQHRIV